MNNRVLFYVQHLLGIGHIARASRIADALAANGLDVTVVTGGMPVQGFPGPGVKTLSLPPVAASNTGFSGLADQHGEPVSQAFLDARRDALLHAFRDLKPAIVVIEAFPFGRRQMRFELLPLLEEIKQTSPRPMLVSSIRDILQENRKAGRDEETVDLVKRYFDAVLVHGDPAFVKLEDTFPYAGDLENKVHYTGLVAPDTPPKPRERFDIVVSAGGGAVGFDLIKAAMDAATLVARDKRWLLITGPNLPEKDYAALASRINTNVTLARFRRDFPSIILEAEVSVSQAGYNTVCDLLRARCRAVLVPFVAGGETEQTVRADKLAALGLASVVREAELSGTGLATAIEQALRTGPPPATGLDLEGAQRSADILRQLAEIKP